MFPPWVIVEKTAIEMQLIVCLHWPFPQIVCCLTIVWNLGIGELAAATFRTPTGNTSRNHVSTVYLFGVLRTRENAVISVRMVLLSWNWVEFGL